MATGRAVGSAQIAQLSIRPIQDADIHDRECESKLTSLCSHTGLCHKKRTSNDQRRSVSS